MKTNFKTVVTMNLTAEQFTELEPILKDLDYEINKNVLDFDKNHNYNIITNAYRNNNNIEDLGKIGVTDKGCNLHLKSYNKDLYLALCSMTKGKDWIVGEYLTFIEDGKVFICKSLNGANSHIGDAANKNKHLYRKATIEEIFKYFEIMEEENRFPFKLNMADAKTIINAACQGWRPKLSKLWGEDCFLNGFTVISKDFYKEMRKACTSAQNVIFDKIFGKDRLKFSVGDHVIIEDGGYHPNYENVVLLITKINRTANGNYALFSVMKDGLILDTGYKNFQISENSGRLATKEEVEASKYIKSLTPCFVSNNNKNWKLRYTDGKGKFYKLGIKSGEFISYKYYEVIKDIVKLLGENDTCQSKY